MKKIVLMLVSFFLITGCSSSNKEIVEINFNEYNTKVSNEENFVLYIGSSNCSHCATFKPKLEEVIKKYDLDVYYLDISKISDSEYAKLKNKVFLSGTPTMVYFLNGTYSGNKIVGDKDIDKIIEYFESIDYIGD